MKPRRRCQRRVDIQCSRALNIFMSQPLSDEMDTSMRTVKSHQIMNPQWDGELTTESIHSSKVPFILIIRFV